MRRWSSLVLVSLAVACGGSQTHTAPRVPSHEASDVEDAGGLAFAFIAMPTDEQVLVALFVDAGSRDAEHAQVATLAAWLAASAAPGVAATVYPDVTRFVMQCERDRLRACVGVLREVISRREVSAEELDVLHERLRAVRRGARSDEARRLELSALEGLLGADRLDPLGDASDDAASDASALRRFMSEHYGPSRSLVVLLGSMERDEARSVIAPLRDAPRATSSRPARGAPEVRALSVEGGDADRLGIAIRVPSMQAGARASAALSAGHPEARVSVFPTRGAFVLLASAGAAAPSTLVVDAMRAALDASDEVAAVETGSLAPALTPLDAATRSGMTWMAGAAADAPPSLSVSALSPADDEAGLDARRRVLQSQLDRARALMAIDGGAADFALANGARVVAQRVAGGVSVALRIDGGAGQEPRSAHGRTAILARLLASCASDPRLEIERRVEASSFGIVATARSADWRVAVDALTRCARALRIDAPTLELARARALRDLDLDALRREQVSRALASGAPGVVAPLGATAGLGAIEASALRRVWSTMAVGARVSLAIVGEVPVDEARARALRGLEALASGAAVEVATVLPEPARSVLAIASEDDHTEILLAFRDPALRAPEARAGAEVLLDVVSAALEEVGAVSVWRAADAGPHGTWAALALRAPPAVVEQLEARVLSALSTRAPRAARAAQVGTTPSSAFGALGGAAWRAGARAQVEPDVDAADAAMQLARGGPRWVFVRPAPR